MKQRGRKSAAALSVAEPAISAKSRPEPATDLEPEERLEWIQVVNSLPADWFEPFNLQLLTQYCRHAVTARRVSQLIHQMEQQEEIDLDEYDKLLKMQERESRIIASLLTKMRLSQQAVFSARKTRPNQGAVGAKPWE